MSSKLYPDRSKTDIYTLTDASLSLETAQELSSVLYECTRALQQQLNCSMETSGVVNQVHYAMLSVHGVRTMITFTSTFHGVAHLSFYTKRHSRENAFVFL